jgi:hypothetical protein
MSRHQRPLLVGEREHSAILGRVPSPKKWANKSAESRQSHISGGYLVSRRRFGDLAERESDLLPFGFLFVSNRKKSRFWFNVPVSRGEERRSALTRSVPCRSDHHRWFRRFRFDFDCHRRPLCTSESTNRWPNPLVP